MSRLRLVAIIALAWLGLLAPSAALAQPKADIDRADRLYKEGKAALDAGRIDEACTKLEQSLALDRGVGTLLNLARCHQAQGKNVLAVREYNEASVLAQQRGDAERSRGARELADKLAATLPKLRIDVATPATGLVVKRDGIEVPAAELGAAIPIDPGSHVVTATAAGFEPFTTTVQIGGGAATTAVKIELAKPGAPRPNPSKPVTMPGTPSKTDSSGPGPLFIAGLVVGGAGVAGLAVGAAFGVLTMTELSDAEEDPALCPDKQCTPAGREAVDGARTKGIVSTVAFAVGGAAVAGGVILVVLDLVGGSSKSTTGRTKSQRARLAPGPGDIGATFAIDL